MGWLRKEFTFIRWRSNPFQVCATFFLGLWSLGQLTLGVTPGGVFATEIDHHAQLIVSSTNLLGAVICLAGLHMRDLTSALWVEVIGYVSLIGSLGIYISLAARQGIWNSSYGYGLSIAFSVASIIRAWQIFSLKRAERRAELLRQLVGRIEDPEVLEVDRPDG